jgi:transposase InsO family protein
MELWPLDVMGGVRLLDGTPLSVVTGLDNHSRYCVCARLVERATARPVCDALAAALARHGAPEAILTDNSKVFTARFGPGARPVLFDRICHEHGIKQLLTAPYSPMTTGKVERLHKTLRASCSACARSPRLLRRRRRGTPGSSTTTRCGRTRASATSLQPTGSQRQVMVPWIPSLPELNPGPPSRWCYRAPAYHASAETPRAMRGLRRPRAAAPRGPCRGFQGCRNCRMLRFIALAPPVRPPLDAMGTGIGDPAAHPRAGHLRKLDRAPAPRRNQRHQLGRAACRRPGRVVRVGAKGRDLNPRLLRARKWQPTAVQTGVCAGRRQPSGVK